MTSLPGHGVLTLFLSLATQKLPSGSWLLNWPSRRIPSGSGRGFVSPVSAVLSCQHWCFGATLVQARNDDQRAMKRIVYVSRSPLDSELHRHPLDLAAGAIIWAIKCLGGCLETNPIHTLTDHESVKHVDNATDRNPLAQICQQLPVYTVPHRKVVSNGNADMLLCLPLPATEHGPSGNTIIYPPDPTGAYVADYYDRQTNGSPPPDVSLGGLPRSTASVRWYALPLVSEDFQQFRAQGHG